ncbi:MULTISPECIES: tripartite tricarboxylate transporter permease [unclassified Desulfovibrio]|uniref:tripartite tricarboxylate transporter permease n=1 Tax=unclassified Desulfovibrio TaxID=2593640 RepID=UPI000F603AE6|nr:MULTISPECIES: tripartite tricarboxylate transporter permease [unclassified Desulfovibrio]RRD70700.1 C4-dicarboxylate ABC transporter permease [Desulfovibrio sp. OH1209_COT-279]RRD87102.1 C4-dicarboxylate ABC transporter permease [Desulfovibrio sp. OH1186_COT-070]
MDIFAGLQQALTPAALFANCSGVALGIIFGSLPGLTAAMGVALLIPLSFGMPTVEAFSLLLGMYCGAIYGGCISAILVGTPGTVAAAATMLEGPKLTAKGQSLKALDMATWASFLGGTFSGIALVTCAPLLAMVAMRFGAPEYFALSIFALTAVTTFSSGNILKGFTAAFFGLFLSSVGIDQISGDFRNTFNIPDLFNGIPLVPALVGLFAVSQVMLSLEDIFHGQFGMVKYGSLSNDSLTFKELLVQRLNLLRSAVIGTAIGIIPAMGASAACFIAYSEAKRRSATPEAFGTGTLEGIAATESSNNAVTGGALIPMMVLGVPGDVLTALLLGALMIQGLVPGPLLFSEHEAVISGIFASFFVAQMAILGIGLLAVRIAGKIVHVPTPILMPIVLVLCAVGSYAANNSTFDLWIMAGFGLLGYLMIKGGFPQPPLLLALILGPIAESNFRRTLSISRNDASIFVTSPISCTILLISLLLVIKVALDELCRTQSSQRTHL